MLVIFCFFCIQGEIQSGGKRTFFCVMMQTWVLDLNKALPIIILLADAGVVDVGVAVVAAAVKASCKIQFWDKTYS